MNSRDRGVTGGSGEELVFVDETQLHPLQVKPTLAQYISNLWNARYFVFSYAKSQSFNEGQGTFLGKFWLVLDPLLQIAIYALVFGLILETNRGIANFLGFLTIGVIYFRFLSQGLTTGSKLIQKNSGLLASFGFPRASLVASGVLRNFFNNIPAALVAILVSLLFQNFSNISWVIILSVPLYLILNMFASGLTLITARLTAFLPDISKLISLVSRALFFTSGVFFTLERFDGNSKLQTVIELNPFYVFLEMFRSLVIDGVSPDLASWGYVLLWATCIFAGGFLFFWRAETRYHNVG